MGMGEGCLLKTITCYEEGAHRGRGGGMKTFTKKGRRGRERDAVRRSGGGRRRRRRCLRRQPMRSQIIVKIRLFAVVKQWGREAAAAKAAAGMGGRAAGPWSVPAVSGWQPRKGGVNLTK